MFGAVALAAVVMIGVGEEQARRLHREKYLAILELLEKEVAKRPHEREYMAPVSPAEIAALLEREPAAPLENKGNYSEERYSFSRGLLGSLDLIVFYKQTADGPRLYSVADMNETRPLTRPQP
jgi:hypothetical protein